MFKQYIGATIIRRHKNHGNTTQFYVALTDSEGNKEFLWMNDYDYMDWIEDPLVLNGKTMMFDAENYYPFA